MQVEFERVLVAAKLGKMDEAVKAFDSISADDRKCFIHDVRNHNPDLLLDLFEALVASGEIETMATSGTEEVRPEGAAEEGGPERPEGTNQQLGLKKPPEATGDGVSPEVIPFQPDGRDHSAAEVVLEDEVADYKDGIFDGSRNDVKNGSDQPIDSENVAPEELKTDDGFRNVGDNGLNDFGNDAKEDKDAEKVNDMGQVEADQEDGTVNDLGKVEADKDEEEVAETVEKED